MESLLTLWLLQAGPDRGSPGGGLGALAALLLWAGLFYVMMRFGCGAHMVHGSHGDHGDHGAPEGRATTSRDPVCGMEVAPDQGYARIVEGREYRFCSRKCLDEFDADPGRFLGREPPTQDARAGHGTGSEHDTGGER